MPSPTLNYTAKSLGISEIETRTSRGNWFTSNDLNKEMKVLAQSYDWLLFLTDAGLAEFIRALLLEPSQELAAARTAFLASYGPHATENRFTKVSIDLEADDALQLFFRRHLGEATTWFNVISPAGHSLIDLQEQIRGLASKPWDAIHMEAQE